MSTILRDPTAGLLDIPAQPLGPRHGGTWMATHGHPRYSL